MNITFKKGPGVVTSVFAGSFSLPWIVFWIFESFRKSQHLPVCPPQAWRLCCFTWISRSLGMVSRQQLFSNCSFLWLVWIAWLTGCPSRYCHKVGEGSDLSPKGNTFNVSSVTSVAVPVCTAAGCQRLDGEMRPIPWRRLEVTWISCNYGALIKIQTRTAQWRRYGGVAAFRESEPNSWLRGEWEVKTWVVCAVLELNERPQYQMPHSKTCSSCSLHPHHKASCEGLRTILYKYCIANISHCESLAGWTSTAELPHLLHANPWSITAARSRVQIAYSKCVFEIHEPALRTHNAYSTCLFIQTPAHVTNPL